MKKGHYVTANVFLRLKGEPLRGIWPWIQRKRIYVDPYHSRKGTIIKSGLPVFMDGGKWIYNAT